MHPSSLGKLVAALAVVAASGLSARALTLNLPADYSYTVAGEIDAAGWASLGLSDQGDPLYKSSPPTPTEVGPLKDSYTAAFNPASGGGTITITWDGPLVADATYLVVKDGNLGSRIWDISGWNGTDTIDIGDAFPTKDTISHVEFFGTSHKVPDRGTSLALLGLGMFGLACIRRK